MKRLIIILLACMLATIGALSCGEPEATTTTTTQPTTTQPTTTQPATTPPTTTQPTTTEPTTTEPTTTEPSLTELTVSDHNPPEGPPGETLDAWAAWVGENSAGTLELTVFHGAALLTGEEAFRGTQTGICDVAYYVLDRQQGFLLNLIMTLPFMGFPDQAKTAQIYQDLMDEFPEMVEEWEGRDVRIVSFIMMPGTHLHNDVREIITPEDLAGLSIHGAEAALVEVIEAAGGTAAELDIADMYMSLETGLLDGVFNHFPVLFIFGVIESMQYHTIFGDGINKTPMMIVMNNDIYNDLPAEAQSAIDNSAPFWAEIFLEADLGFQGFTMGLAQEAGQEFIYLTPEQIAVWQDLVRDTIHQSWIDECEAAGLPGQAVYDRAIELIEEYS